MIKRYIGIDLGTSNTIMFYRDYPSAHMPGVALYVDDDSARMIPTAIYERPDGTRQYGVKAERSAGRSGIYHQGFKMELVSDDERKAKESQELMRDFFHHLRKCYAKVPRLDADGSEHTFVSYPAKWPSHSITAVENAAKEAGFQNVESLDEPNAALHYCLQHQDGASGRTRLERLQDDRVLIDGQELNIMLVDLGAGTTDIVISRYKPGQHSLFTTAIFPLVSSKDTFGGREIDRCLFALVTDHLRKEGKTLPPRLTPSMLIECRRWKEDTISCVLAQNEEVRQLPLDSLLDTFDEPLQQLGGFDRKGFERLLGAYLDTFPRLVNGAIAASIETGSGIKSSNDIDLVILTGGHSRWYFVRELLLGQMSSPSGLTIDLPRIRANTKRLLQMDAPEETVARGLAYKGTPLKLKSVFANNIWLAPTIGLSTLEPILLVKQYEPLPYKPGAIKSKNLHYKYDVHKPISISCKLLVGETIAQALQYPVEMHVNRDPLIYLADLLDELIDGKSISGTVAEITTTVDLRENRRGTVRVSVHMGLAFGQTISTTFAI